MLPNHCALAHILKSVDCFIAIVTINSTTVPFSLTASKGALTIAAKTGLA